MIRKIQILLFTIISLSIGFETMAQCIVDADKAQQILDEALPADRIIGEWGVNIRGTLFYKTNILQSDYESYDATYYLLPKANGYEICTTDLYKDELINGLLIRDDVMPEQFFFYDDSRPEKELTMGKMVSDSILSFHFKADPATTRQRFAGQVKEEAMDDLVLLWEYILIRK